ncbi:integrase-recombinase protein [Leptolyngbya boryana NIES-2135]|jgi:integrase/recombinase XerC|uniref:Integrase-recombinase protein n=1 Tax=Leptolyngbya boryana NIES-2135 TaxID=1973484 RepID=A0A1Z4JET3_LEPBY|nr:MULTISPECIES: tyrosine-type recombinase/integrase [Leptolyngbya]BAY55295.1 integrase-recombinase protein [Leptolyngbya boryana NIES-2135]MBD2369378.1 tyrosine-type recombinase/integrase [Leptolyngbya sp. FACHB-161]MBD2375620.1 tyrosine-type recombinase/integrase [Leptolyngbya sp. FACHB-238]MBD2401707.1 tyrosine-type recombinase/integrase [Leptolyngbya sp. FACHB-239]MBD2406554.1 tyrosine-type recombinase/integrase [Leptolyngbya sp. FACHB-402]
MSDLIQSSSFGSFRLIEERDLLQELLADKRSPETRRAYERCLKDFFRVLSNQEPSPQLIREFLELERFTAIQLVLSYKAHLISKGLAEATINQRIAAVKSLVTYAQKVGKCLWSLEEVQGQKIRAYRDTSGVDRDNYLKILNLLDRSTLKGCRDYALFLLLWSNVLRRGEVSKINCSDFDSDSGSLWILGKGRGKQKERVTLDRSVTDAIAEWLARRGKVKPDSPLFTSISRSSAGHRLTGDGIYKIVRETAEKAGIKKILSPHRIRHSGITEALELTNGDVRKVQKLSRHASVNTVLLYDDSRKNTQGEMSELLARSLKTGQDSTSA